MAAEVAPLTFANYNLEQQSLGDIYNIGANSQHPTGVIPEMAMAFGHQLTPMPNVDNLGDLIGRVGPAKELQNNIAGVQAALQTTTDAVGIARGWAEHSGLLVPVERSYASGEAITESIDLMVATGGVRNWMVRRAEVMKSVHDEYGADRALLVAGNRPMKTTEGPDVIDGMTEADYMQEVVAKQLAAYGVAATVVEVKSGLGDEVMKAGAEKARELTSDTGRILVASNAAAWPQNVGQFSRATKDAGAFGSAFDRDGRQLFVASDGFALGQTGTEPTVTHQNPFTAAGQIVRNAQELARQYQY